MVRILVIGGTGVIGTAVSRHLLERGHHVTLYTRGRTEVRLPTGGRVGAASVSLTGDRKDHAAFEQQMRYAGPFDGVVDMICYGPEDAASLVRAFVGRVRRVVFCSTASVYPWPPSRYPVREDEPLGRDSAYGVGKAAAEAIFLDAHARGDFSATVLRLGHTYGEGRAMLHPLGSSSTLIDRLRRGKAVVLHGDGSSLWAACHADDVAYAFASAFPEMRAAAAVSWAVNASTCGVTR